VCVCVCVRGCVWACGRVCVYTCVCVCVVMVVEVGGIVAAAAAVVVWWWCRWVEAAGNNAPTRLSRAARSWPLEKDMQREPTLCSILTSTQRGAREL
jgi:hypothetical protein